MFHVQKFTEETNHGTIPKSVQYIDTTNGLKNKNKFYYNLCILILTKLCSNLEPAKWRDQATEPPITCLVQTNESLFYF